jgi:hypothetical protein
VELEEELGVVGGDDEAVEGIQAVAIAIDDDLLDLQPERLGDQAGDDRLRLAPLPQARQRPRAGSGVVFSHADDSRRAVRMHLY